MKHIVMFSGGKDSTAMLLMMIEKGMQIDDIVYANTGLEYPEMQKHILQVEEYINRPITKLIPHGNKTFEYYLKDAPRKKRNGDIQYGYGWPSFHNRWCTSRLKSDPIKKYLQKYTEYVEYHGIAFDEPKRIKDKKNIVYPLVEWKMNEAEALQYCYDHGFYWQGLYNKISRASCYLCPLQRYSHLEVIYNHYPELWEHMKYLDENSIYPFSPQKTLQDHENKFKAKNEQGKLF